MNMEKSAKIISIINNPPIICIPLFLIISAVLARGDVGKFITLEMISIVFASVIPMAIILGWAKILGTDNDISNRTDRFAPLIVGIISYFIGFLVSLYLKVDIFMSILLLCYTINTFIVMLITTRWKISIHTTGLSGPVGALILLLGPLGAIFGLLFPVLIWSRVYLKKHTMAQAIAGGVQGFFLTVFEMYLIIYIFNIVITNIQALDVVTWLILAIILTPVTLGILSYIKIKNSRIIFYLTQILFIAVFVMFAPVGALSILVLDIITCILIAHYANKDYPWHEIIN